MGMKGGGRPAPVLVKRPSAGWLVTDSDVPFSVTRTSQRVGEKLGESAAWGALSPRPLGFLPHLLPQAVIRHPSGYLHVWPLLLSPAEQPLCLEQWRRIAGSGLGLSPAAASSPSPVATLRHPPPFLPPFVTVLVCIAFREPAFGSGSVAERGWMSCIFQAATHHYPSFQSTIHFKIIFSPDFRLFNPNAEPQLAQPWPSQGMWFGRRLVKGLWLDGVFLAE